MSISIGDDATATSNPNGIAFSKAMVDARL